MENLNFVVLLFMRGGGVLSLLASPLYAIENGWHELLKQSLCQATLVYLCI